MKKRKITVLGICIFLGGLYLYNASWLATAHPENREILAHRGLHQTYDPKGVENETCTADRIDAPVHNYMENTLPAIEAAIDMGADIIEFDIHPTTDGEFVVFHDWTLGCRTDGTGVVRKHDSQYLKTLDIGYGYTADGGKTYPFRGHFIGAMPTLNELLNAYPDTAFFLNIKSRDVWEVEALTTYLKDRALKDRAMGRAQLSVYGGDVVHQFKTLNPDIKTLTKNGAKECLKSYLVTGWSGYMPKACRDTYVPVPENFQWAVWGWPARFEARLEKVGSRAILFGSKTKAHTNRAIDSPASIAAIPKDFGGIIWTNRIDLFADDQ